MCIYYTRAYFRNNKFNFKFQEIMRKYFFTQFYVIYILYQINFSYIKNISPIFLYLIENDNRNMFSVITLVLLKIPF